MKSDILICAGAAILLGQAWLAVFLWRSLKDGCNLHPIYRPQERPFEPESGEVRDRHTP